MGIFTFTIPQSDPLGPSHWKGEKLIVIFFSLILWRRCRYIEYIHLEDIANILCEYRRAETLLHLVVPIDAFVKAGALQQVDNGSKRFPGDVLHYIRLNLAKGKYSQ